MKFPRLTNGVNMYMKDVENMRPSYYDWPNVIEKYTKMAQEIGFHVVSCELCQKDHEYIPYLVWRSVNPYLARIRDSKEKEEFIEECHKETMNSPRVLPEYPSSWSKLLIVQDKLCNLFIHGQTEFRFVQKLSDTGFGWLIFG